MKDQQRVVAEAVTAGARNPVMVNGGDLTDAIVRSLEAHRVAAGIRPTHIGEMMTAVMDRLTMTESVCRGDAPIPVKLTGYTMHGAAAEITDPMDGRVYVLTLRPKR